MSTWLAIGIFQGQSFQIALMALQKRNRAPGGRHLYRLALPQEAKENPS
jgi:hypothetical protein